MKSPAPRRLMWVCGFVLLLGVGLASAQPALRSTIVSIVGDQFYLNGEPTYKGRTWKGLSIEGLLLNSRMVQGTFDDLNSETAGRWAYPDTGKWDAERNTREFLDAMPAWRAHGLLAFTLNLQGGSPQGYSREQPWHNSAFQEDGTLRPDYLQRLERIIDRADQLGMVVILGYFYFGQDQRLKDEEAVRKAADNATRWVLAQGWRNVIIEINNEANVRYDHAILQPERVHELIETARDTAVRGRRLLVGTSFGGGTIPPANVVRYSDFLLIHGNGVSEPERIGDMVRKTRAVAGYRGQPILFNEDDHFDFDRPTNNFVAAVGERASWGYFDFRMKDEGFDEGYQSVPVNWAISSARKRGFFGLLKEITGEAGLPATATMPVAVPAIEKGSGKVTVTRTNYHGWADSILLENGLVQVVVVPAIGRVMSFGFVGEENPLWEKASLFGKLPDSKSSEWANFGGDKSWPAPMASWPKVMQRAWPPPTGFDAMPATALVLDTLVTVSTQVDPQFGIRMHRTFALDPRAPVLRITTRFDRVFGGVMPVGVWVITQLDDPVGIYVPVPEQTVFPGGYHAQSGDLPPDLTLRAGVLSLTRPKDKSTKIGLDAETLLWVGVRTMVRLDSPRDPHGTYPDKGSSAEVYTNQDPEAYVELEMLGPLKPLATGQSIEASTVYTLYRRTLPDPESDARRVLGR